LTTSAPHERGTGDIVAAGGAAETAHVDALDEQSVAQHAIDGSTKEAR
jgi:hypothetical protein